MLRVTRVTCREGAIWPFTVVGRPPQEDTVFGQLIHELTAPVIPTVIPGVQAVHAVDAAGVHPLMLAIGSERYVPYESRRLPRELLTQAHAILGQGQMSLAKYLWIVDGRDDRGTGHSRCRGLFPPRLGPPGLATRPAFPDANHDRHVGLFGHAPYAGSKLILAAAGPAVGELVSALPTELHLPPGFTSPRVCLPGSLGRTGTGLYQRRARRPWPDSVASSRGRGHQPVPVGSARG